MTCVTYVACNVCVLNIKDAFLSFWDEVVYPSKCKSGKSVNMIISSKNGTHVYVWNIAKDVSFSVKICLKKVY